MIYVESFIYFLPSVMMTDRMETTSDIRHSMSVMAGIRSVFFALTWLIGKMINLYYNLSKRSQLAQMKFLNLTSWPFCQKPYTSGDGGGWDSHKSVTPVKKSSLPFFQKTMRISSSFQVCISGVVSHESF